MTTYDELQFAEVETPPVLAAQVGGQSAPDPSAISAAIGAAFGTLIGFMGRHAVAPGGPPRAVYTAYGREGVSFTVAIPVAPVAAAPPDEPPVTVGSLPAGKAYRFTHRGPYRNLMQTYGNITAFLKAKGCLQSDADWARYMPMWEEYRNDPETTPEADLLTYIYLPVGG
jgi:effector-binding domain-containing protein